PPVCDRILADRQLVRDRLSRPAVLDRLRARPETIGQLAAWAVEEQRGEHLLAPGVQEAVGTELIAQHVEEAGWDRRRAGQRPQVGFAFDTLLPRLRRRPGYDARLPRLNVASYPRPAQEFLVNVLLEQGKLEQVAAWLAALTPDLLPPLLTDRRASAELQGN